MAGGEQGTRERSAEPDLFSPDPPQAVVTFDAPVDLKDLQCLSKASILDPKPLSKLRTRKGAVVAKRLEHSGGEWPLDRRSLPDGAAVRSPRLASASGSAR